MMEPMKTESANNLLVAVAQAHVQYHDANPTKVYIKKSTERVAIRTQFKGRQAAQGGLLWQLILVGPLSY